MDEPKEESDACKANAEEYNNQISDNNIKYVNQLHSDCDRDSVDLIEHDVDMTTKTQTQLNKMETKC